MTTTAPRSQLAALAPAAVTAALVAVGALFLASRDGEPGIAPVLWVFLAAVPYAAAWLVAAAGFGVLLARTLGLRDIDPMATMAGGVAVLLTIDSALARTGLLGPVVAWLVIGIGVGVAVVTLARGLRRWSVPAGDDSWWLVVQAPAVAALLVAAVSAPGWLWATEFGGYDVLSYHLQLPKEWLAVGRASGLEHNVYSFFPSLMETAYLHLAVLTGDAVAAAVPAQLLHAGLTVLTAVAVARLARRLARDAHIDPIPFGLGAGMLILATPWIIVVGSLAYNEMTVAFFLVAGLLVLDAGAPTGRGAILLGVLIGAAVGAKLTAVGFVAAPLIVLAIRDGRGARMRVIVTVALFLTACVPLLPTWIANTIDTGNPVFPFLLDVFGHGHWTAEQAAIWHDAHVPHAGVGARFAAAWNQILWYGLGTNPSPTEPWSPQWALLPWLAIAGAIVGLLRPNWRPSTTRWLVVLGLQLIFWLGFTHLKSRFMLPAVVPAALLGANVIAVKAIRLHRLPTAALLLVLTCVPAALLMRERGGNPAAMIGGETIMTGAAHAALIASDATTDPVAIEQSAPAAYWLNHRLDPDAKILGIGEAAPFYIGHDGFEYTTTWDRGPLSEALATHGPGWPAELARQGYTHVLLEPTMLNVWTRSGWIDPRIDVDALVVDLDGAARTRWRIPLGGVLYELVGAPSP